MNSTIQIMKPMPVLERFCFRSTLLRALVASCYYSHRIHKPHRNAILSIDRSPGTDQNQTVELFRLAHAGDRDAMNRLFERLAPPLQRWASGRMPAWARSMVSTVDLVQEALLSTFKVIESAGTSDHIAIHAYVRTSLKNRMIDELRKVQRRPVLQEINQTFDGESPSPLEEVIGGQALERYEKALAGMDENSRDAIIARVELGLAYEDIAKITGKNSADAARMNVSRALVRLAKAMGDD